MQALDGDYWSGLEQDRYEAHIIEEARAIVEGRLNQPPTVEHLRVALAWLDGGQPIRAEALPPF